MYHEPQTETGTQNIEDLLNALRSLAPLEGLNNKEEQNSTSLKEQAKNLFEIVEKLFQIGRQLREKEGVLRQAYRNSQMQEKSSASMDSQDVLQQMQVHLKEANAKNTILQAQLKAANATNTMLENQLKEANATNTMLENQLKEANATNTIPQDTLNASANERQDVSTNNSSGESNNEPFTTAQSSTYIQEHSAYVGLSLLIGVALGRTAVKSDVSTPSPKQTFSWSNTLKSTFITAQLSTIFSQVWYNGNLVGPYIQEHSAACVIASGLSILAGGVLGRSTGSFTNFMLIAPLGPTFCTTGYTLPQAVNQLIANNGTIALHIENTAKPFLIACQNKAVTYATEHPVLAISEGMALTAGAIALGVKLASGPAILAEVAGVALLTTAMHSIPAVNNFFGDHETAIVTTCATLGVAAVALSVLPTTTACVASVAAGAAAYMLSGAYTDDVS